MLAALLVGVALLLAVLCWLRFVRELDRMHKVSGSIPGLPLQPVVGNALILKGVKPEDLLHEMMSLAEGSGDIVRLWLGPTLLVFLQNPQDLEAFFTHPAMHSKAAYAYGFATPILGEGLLTINGRGHRKHRKLVTPSLHYGILQDFLSIQQKLSSSTCEKLSALADSGALMNATTMMGMYSLNALCETLFCSAAPAELDSLVEGLERSGELILDALVKPWFQFKPLYRLSSRCSEFLRTGQKLHTFVTEMLARRSRELREVSQQENRGRREAFLDRVLNEKGTMADTELIEEMKSLTFAAVVTTMDFLSMFLLVLSVRQDVQQAVQRELDEVLGPDSTRPVEESDLRHMQYLERVVKEVLRLFPPVPMLARQVEGEDVALPSGHVLPRGAMVLIAPYAVHRDQRFFADPLRFDPDRFLPENTRGRNPFTYIPFSAGARNCVGQRYAMNSIKVVASNMLRQFTFLPKPGGPQAMEDIEPLIGVTLNVVGGVWLRVERRHKSASGQDLDKLMCETK